MPQKWLERECKLMSYREEEEWCEGGEVEDYSCPLCCTLTKYLLVLLLVAFFLVTPALMIHTGITHQACDDIFLVWLTAGRMIVIKRVPGYWPPFPLKSVKWKKWLSFPCTEQG